jgi:peptidoglycan/xylan/chitin deacetylase (PgdA/CDA1 family)
MSLCRADKVLLSGGATILGGSAFAGLTPLAIALPMGALLAVLADGIFRPSSSTLYPTISHGPATQPRVALTFDDGPDPEITPQVLDILRARHAPATFFTIGRNLEQRIDIGQRMVAEGHELANHSWAHALNQNFYGMRAQALDIERSVDLIRTITRRDDEPLYRAPVGLKSPPLARIAHVRQLRMIAWSVHSRDTLATDPDRVAARVLSRVRPGDIVLLHDGHDRPGRHRTMGLKALPKILDGLAERGLEPVTVSTLLAQT